MTEAAIDVPELAKKSSISWIDAQDRIWPVWHEWIEDAVYVVGSPDGNGSEQPIPDVVDGDEVALLLRSKADGSLAAKVAARVEIVGPGSLAWEPVTTALKAGRLNLDDAATAIERWVRECRVLRLVPLASTAGQDLPHDHRQTTPRLS